MNEQEQYDYLLSKLRNRWVLLATFGAVLPLTYSIHQAISETESFGLLFAFILIVLGIVAIRTGLKKRDLEP